MNFREFINKQKIKCKLSNVNKKKYNICVAYHKPYELLESNVLTPIHAGREIALQASKDGVLSSADYEWMLNHMIGDNTGENISDRNRFYNEVSITYWMWKNITSPYVGLMHYRRVFDVNNSIGKNKKLSILSDILGITRKNLDKIFSEYDIILPKQLGFDMSIYDQFAKWHDIADMDFAIDYIKEKFPDIYPYAQKIKTKNVGYFFNMFVTSREIFEGYAEFLFDVLFALENDRAQRNLHQQRVEGFVAERLTGIYFDYLINTRNLKVKECCVKEPPALMKSSVTITRFAVKNKKGKGLTVLLRLKL